MKTGKKRRLVTILYDQDLRSLLQDFIPDGEYEVESAKDGMDAFHKLAKKYFDLIITDFQMPGLAGVNLLPRLKIIQPWARVVVIPTRRLNRYQRKIVESAADAVLAKPFEISQLRTVLQRVFAAADRKDIPTEGKWKSGRFSLEPF